jgi:hypothetical protein
MALEIFQLILCVLMESAGILKSAWICFSKAFCSHILRANALAKVVEGLQEETLFLRLI